jgi:hypothetical protein
MEPDDLAAKDLQLMEGRFRAAFYFGLAFRSGGGVLDPRRFAPYIACP